MKQGRGPRVPPTLLSLKVNYTLKTVDLIWSLPSHTENWWTREAVNCPRLFSTRSALTQAPDKDLLSACNVPGIVLGPRLQRCIAQTKSLPKWDLHSSGEDKQYINWKTWHWIVESATEYGKQGNKSKQGLLVSIKLTVHSPYVICASLCPRKWNISIGALCHALNLESGVVAERLLPLPPRK